MAGFLTTGLSALIGARAALDVTGHNIANASTPGYSRQRVNFQPQQAQLTPVGYIGNGVTSSGIERILDRFLADGIIESQSSSARLTTLADVSGRLSNLFADADLGLAPSLQSFFNSLQDAASDPASVELRTLVLGQAEALTQRFNLMAGELNRIETDLNARIEGTVDEINSLTAEIADLNDQIVLARRGGNNVANDLLDQRDLSVQKLSELVAIETVEDSSGYINVIARPGTSLVVGTLANAFTIGQDNLRPDYSIPQVAATIGGNGADVQVAGGRLGGLLEARDQLLAESRRELGLAALGLLESVNATLGAGYDLDDNFGAALFSASFANGVTANTNNAGTAGLSVAIGDVSALENADYRLSFDGTNFSVQDADTGAAIALTGTGSAGDPLVFAGLAITVNGTPGAGDEFLVRPAAAAAEAIEVALSDPRGLAFAAPVRTSASLSNLGNALISIPAVTDPTDPQLLTTTTITFSDASTYTINGGGAQAYNSGDVITVNGVEVTISGVPAAGDSFVLEANNGGRGDNANLLSLAALRTDGVLAGGNTSVLESYASLVTDVGATTRNLQAGAEAQSVLLNSRLDEQSEVSGVDLDEEAANLIRFQQSYQAAAQLVAVANTLFDELIGAVR